MLVGARFEKPTDRNILLVNIHKLKKDSFIDDNVSDHTIRVAAMAVQDMVIEKVTGTCLFDKLRELICDDTINDEYNWCYTDLLDNYLFQIFAYGVPAEISIPLSFKNRNNGTVRPNTDTTTQAGLSDIKYLNQYYLNKMDHYVNRAIRYLKCNCCFPELKCCECDWANERPFSKGPSVSINLSMKNVKKHRF